MSTICQTQTNDAVQDLQILLASLPSPYVGAPREDTRQALESDASIPLLIVLDDDPTGTQTCHDIAVLSVWNTPILIEEVKRTPAGSGFFILTNSRALHPSAAAVLVREICANVKQACSSTGRSFEIVLRGDSTLRGHFPEEPRGVEDMLGVSDAWILVPFFLQGGRYTINDTHYVAEGATLVPAGQTPFARDATFGYRSSNMRDWVVEKSCGSVSKDCTISLDLTLIRQHGPSGVCEALMNLVKGSVVIVNAAAEEDVDVVVRGILQGSACLHNMRSFIVNHMHSVTARQTIPVSHWSDVRVCSSRYFTHPSNLRRAIGPPAWHRRPHNCRILRSMFHFTSDLSHLSQYLILHLT